MSNKENDRYQWMRETAEHLRAGELGDIDPVAVADWFDEVSNSDRRELISRLRCIIEHRLKLDYVQGGEWERNRRGWQLTVGEQRSQIDILLEESPTLRNRLTPEVLDKAYHAVACNVADAYGVTLPGECLYSYDELLLG
jgi:hypothetical protein